jgi:hypothetical protein
MHDDPNWRKQYHDDYEWRYDRDLVLHQIGENTEDIECVDKQVTLNTLRIAKIWTVSGALKVVVLAIIGLIGTLVGLFIKLAPVLTKILKLLEEAPKK